ncbi:MAG: hypothetical protein C4586_03735 [Anaerolineaceae bacterium]|nr:MAG: hypothetical protein C4586_03735 [Anaerolineaceae bacterium]
MQTKKSKKPVNVIAFPATVASIKTLVDGGINVTLSLDENSIMQVAALLECKKECIPLRVEIMAGDNEVKHDNK